MEEFIPKQIVNYLDNYIVGQDEAKKSLAVALRNRYRRRKLPAELQEEISPKNIIMIGPTGVGKTELARRLAKLVHAPFIKIEATKFTEVGYVGRDVESMIRDLLEVAIRMTRQEMIKDVEEKAARNAEERLLTLIVPSPRKEKTNQNPLEFLFGKGENANDPQNEIEDQRQKKIEGQRAIIKEKLRRQELEAELVEIEVEDSKTPMLEIFSGSGMEEMGINLQDALGGMFPKKTKKRMMPISEAREILKQQEAEKLIDMDEVVANAINLVEQEGIVFLDEIDKIVDQGSAHGPDVSRGGVQRDILPIVEGSTVNTKYGPVKTDYILFIAAGAFHVVKPSDLIPELQGRFPIRVELDSLNEQDFRQIMTEPSNSLLKQYKALLETEGIIITFSDEAVAEIASIAFKVNAQTENIGARRLHTILERLLQDLFFEAPEVSTKNLTIDKKFVQDKLAAIVEDQDLSRYIL